MIFNLFVKKIPQMQVKRFRSHTGIKCFWILMKTSDIDNLKYFAKLCKSLECAASTIIRIELMVNHCIQKLWKLARIRKFGVSVVNEDDSLHLLQIITKKDIY